MSTRRIRRLEGVLQEEISDILRKEVRDPRVGFASITRVEVAADMSQAKVFVSIYGSDEEKKECLKALDSAAGFIRLQIGERIRARQTPEILFRLDESIEQGARVFELLRQVQEELGGDKDGDQVLPGDGEAEDGASKE